MSVICTKALGVLSQDLSLVYLIHNDIMHIVIHLYFSLFVVSGGILAMAIIVTFIVAVLLTIAVPIVYRRLRNPRYSELRDIMSPVDT